MSEPVLSSAARKRPLSPHLQIYRWEITSVLSIMHRMTGVALYFGSLLLVMWVTAAAYSPDLFYKLHNFWGTGLGRIFLCGWSICFFYHLMNGVRHLCWDAGVGFELKDAVVTGWTVVIGTIILTAISWSVAFGLESGVVQGWLQ
jgi:succinate dehydrogenase / fumarate reductase cytochrome b subunit